MFVCFVPVCSVLPMNKRVARVYGFFASNGSYQYVAEGLISVRVMARSEGVRRESPVRRVFMGGCSLRALYA